LSYRIARALPIIALMEGSGEDHQQGDDAFEFGELRAPDLVEEILGWKVLAFGDEGRLCHDFDHLHHIVIPTGLSSPTREARWPEHDWLRATCPDEDSGHQPPVEDCTCGIYAVASPAGAEEYIWEAPLTVLVRVALAGKVIPGTWGWRGERARVVALTRTGAGPRDYPQLLAQVARRYDVPILDLDFLEHRAAPPAQAVPIRRKD
jgi:hypothetical protein